MSTERSDRELEEASLVPILTNSLDVMNKKCEERKKEISMTGILTRTEDVVHGFTEELKRIEQEAFKKLQSVYNEHERCRSELENEREKIKLREEELKQREALSESEKRKFDKEKEMNERELSEQIKFDEKMMQLAFKQKREKDEHHKRIIELESQLDQKQKLELEIVRMKGVVRMIRHMNEEGDLVAKKKMESIEEELQDKVEELKLFEALIVKQHKANDELVDARKELIYLELEIERVKGAIKLIEDIEGMKKLECIKENLKDTVEMLEALTHTNQILMIKEGRANIELMDTRKELIQGVLRGSLPNMSIKYMGELDEKAFGNDVEVISLWNDHLRDTSWHPFKIIKEGDNVKEEIDEDDEKLVRLKKEVGEGAYEAMKTALKEMNEYNPSGRYPVPELWNRKEGRKVTVREAVAYVLQRCKGSGRNLQYSIISVKLMGELEEKPFCKDDDLYSSWDDHLRDPSWHPFKIITEGDEVKEEIDEDDEKLVRLKKEVGEAAYEAMKTALKEMNEYNPSGRYPVPELWNHKERRKVTITELVVYLLQSLE